jgi:pimeloyl-ACP methyl ester carboxylesterase
MIDTGTGPPIVLIPGIQGRWEWMSPAVRALSTTHRVLSFSLSEISPGIPAPEVFFSQSESYIDGLLDKSGLGGAAVVGVSFGGVIAARYAARRPERVTALILVSSPAPAWPLEPRRLEYLRRPLVSAPAFAFDSVGRLMPEVVAARPTRLAQLGFLAAHIGRVLRFPASPSRMAAWIKGWQVGRDEIECARIAAPTLLITGESDLDRVVPQSSTLEYLRLVPGARHVVLPHTGHVGLLTTPEAFAQIVGQFVEETGTGRKEHVASRKQQVTSSKL